ncbi:MAG: alpha/beta fold hydrolase [Pseudomonadota bacterium]
MKSWIAPLLGTLLAAAGSAQAQETREHSVTVTSTVPAIAGQKVKLYLRERALPQVLRRGAGDKVVLFIHGAGTPAEVAFDVPYQDYSWMAYLAKAGYDVFSVDMTGYGRSHRPAPMAQACKAAPAGNGFGTNCLTSYPGNLTTIESDWNDISAAVNFIKQLRKVQKVNLIGWSQGGPRAGGWAANHPGEVGKLILLAPAYNRAAKDNAPAALPVPGATYSTQDYDQFIANWDRQVGCADQFDKRTAASVWSEMLKSDPVGAARKPPVRRASLASTGWGWTQARVKAMTTPTLMVAGTHDVQVTPARVKEFYADIGSPQKTYVELGCASHNAMWEKDRHILFKASLEWLEKGTVEGQKNAMLRLGFQ